jgi:hypothetical protein
MSGHNLGEDAYLAYVANIGVPPTCRKRWHELDPAREQPVWEKVAAAVALRLCLNNLAVGHHGPLPLPSPLFGPADPTAHALDPTIQLLSEEVEAVQEVIAAFDAGATQVKDPAACTRMSDIFRSLLRRAGLRGMVPKIDERLAEHASARREAYEAPPAWPPIQRIKERSDEPQDMPRTNE